LGGAPKKGGVGDFFSGGGERKKAFFEFPPPNERKLYCTTATEEHIFYGLIKNSFPDIFREIGKDFGNFLPFQEVQS